MPDLTLPQLSITVSIFPLILWVVYGIILIIVAMASMFLIYHWQRYSFDKKILKNAMYVYLLVSFCLLFISTVSLILYTLSSKT